MTTRKSARFRVRQCLSRYPVHYKQAFACSAILYPQRQQHRLRFACRSRQHYGLALFRMNFRVVRTPPVRRRRVVHDAPGSRGHTLPRTVLVQACQHFWLALGNDVYQRFTYVGRTRSFLAPLRLCAGRFRFPSRVGVPIMSAVTLSPKLQTELLPAPHVRVGNG